MRNQFKILLFTLIVGSSIISCSVTKKDQRALNRVKANVNLLNDVGAVWATLNPCPPSKDSIVYGKPDTVTTTVDANNDYLFVIIDSLLRIKCPTLNVDSLRKAYKKQVKPDTVKLNVGKIYTIYRPDPRQLQLYNDRVKYLEGQNEILKQQLIKADNKNDYLTRKWWITLAAAIVVIGGLIFIIFKK